MSNYVWNISPNSGTITWVTGSNQVMVFWNTPGAHWVSVSYTSAGGCTAAAPTQFNVTVHALPAAAGAITGTTTLCAGTNSVTYTTGTIGNSTGYSWTVPAGATITSGATTNTIVVNFGPNAVSGAITVSGTNACGNGPSSTLNVTVNPIPATPVVTQSGNVLLTSSAPTGNQWYKDGVIITGATDQTYLAVYDGDYTVIVTLLGCSSAPSLISTVLITGAEELVKVQKVEVYPNPNNGRFTLSVTSTSLEVFDLRIMNNLGMLVYERKDLTVNGSLKEMIDLQNLPNGVYSVILNTTGKQIVRKFVKD
jgi:hypothetical protein